MVGDEKKNLVIIGSSFIGLEVSSISVKKANVSVIGMEKVGIFIIIAHVWECWNLIYIFQLIRYHLKEYLGKKLELCFKNYMKRKELNSIWKLRSKKLNHLVSNIYIIIFIKLIKLISNFLILYHRNWS